MIRGSKVHVNTMIADSGSKAQAKGDSTSYGF